MWESKSYLTKCESLKQKGHEPNYEPGLHLGRGFADLGCEEFCLLTNNRLISLFTGTISELFDADRHFFFEIPTVSRLLEVLHVRGWNVLKIESENQRDWSMEMVHFEKGNKIVINARSIKDLLIDSLIFSFS
ncbi:MAG: hypothetical protein SGJ02_07630 [bacterium]|mgnify:CR=1 FL=1|nr:hypothetical protein [bacterium]